MLNIICMQSLSNLFWDVGIHLILHRNIKHSTKRNPGGSVLDLFSIETLSTYIKVGIYYCNYQNACICFPHIFSLNGHIHQPSFIQNLRNATITAKCPFFM